MLCVFFEDAAISDSAQKFFHAISNTEKIHPLKRLKSACFLSHFLCMRWKYVRH